jgi:hypothetical protein
MEQLELKEVEFFKDQIQEIIKPYQQEQNQRQKKIDFFTKCIKSIEKNDFFELDELLRNKQAFSILEDPKFNSCDNIFNQLREFAQIQIDNYRTEFKSVLSQMAQEAGLPFEMDFPKFFILKGIEGQLDLINRKTSINQFTLKSMNPKRIIATAIKLKRNLYDMPFEPQIFINSLFQCYKNILKKENYKIGDVVPIHQLYTDYVWSLQSKTFFQNMDKGKFRGYSVEQFAVDLWRFFESKGAFAEGEYRIRLNSGRGKSFWLIDQNGEKRQITHALFAKK